MGILGNFFREPCRGDFERHLYDKDWMEKKEHKRKMSQGKLQKKFLEQGGELSRNTDKEVK